MKSFAENTQQVAERVATKKQWEYSIGLLITSPVSYPLNHTTLRTVALYTKDGYACSNIQNVAGTKMLEVFGKRKENKVEVYYRLGNSHIRRMTFSFISSLN